jgi:hypothetical protein
MLFNKECLSASSRRRRSPIGRLTAACTFDHADKLVRRYASNDRPEPVVEKELDIPTYRLRRPQILPAGAFRPRRRSQRQNACTGFWVSFFRSSGS